MFILVSYDIGETQIAAGRKRLRHVARICKNYGQRVQFSVFELKVKRAQWLEIRRRLLDAANLEKDSLRFYFLEDGTAHEHHGVKPTLDLEGPLIF